MPGIRLSGFSLDVLDSVTPDPTWDPDETVDKAVGRYLADRELRPPGWACLSLPESDPDAAPERPPLDVRLGAEPLVELEQEAEAQGVSVDALLAHAVAYLWAAENQTATKRSSGRQRGGAGKGPREGVTTGAAPSLRSDPRKL